MINTDRYLKKENYEHLHDLDKFWAKHPNQTILDQYSNKLFKDSKKVLDIGCNTGFNSILQAKKHKDIIFYGIDINTKAIDIARQRADQLKLSNCIFLDWSIFKTKFPDKEFDSAFMIDVFEHIYKEDIPQALQELSRIIKNHLLLIIPYKKAHDDFRHVYHYDIQSLRDLFKDSPFIIEKIERINTLKDANKQALDRINCLLRVR